MNIIVLCLAFVLFQFAILGKSPRVPKNQTNITSIQKNITETILQHVDSTTNADSTTNTDSTTNAGKRGRKSTKHGGKPMMFNYNRRF